MAKVSSERIQQFFDGFDSQEYIVNIEATYYSNEVHLIINHPVHGKSIKTKTFKPFMWVKESGIDALYGGDREKLKQVLRKAKVNVKKLNTKGDDNFDNDRMLDGYNYLFTIKDNGSVNDLLKIIKDGGSEVYSKDQKAPKHFISLPPVEQYMIQSGKRLFKGFDDYNDLHRLQYDLETTGLDPRVDRIFQIGIKDNRDFEHIIEIKSQTEFELGYPPIEKIKPIIKDAIKDFDEAEKNVIMKLVRLGKFDKVPIVKAINTLNELDKANINDFIKLEKIINQEKNDREIQGIQLFFDLLTGIKPDTIAGYNSENFDWDFFFTRCTVLGFDIKQIATGLDKTLRLDIGHNKNYATIGRKRGTLKLGQETENFQQTVLWGYNIIDVSHAVRRAQAINSDIKKWGLKYITEFSKANKPNRVYVEGSKIYKTWIDKENTYAFNDENGDHYIITEDNPIKEGYTEVKGDYIVQRYLKDDLWETEKVDDIYSQASFLISKMLPTTYSRTYTMGTATLWKLLMLTWSYENGLAVPNVSSKRKFTGGLARLLEVGRAENVVKFDYAALYPNIGITHGIFPKVDVMNVMEGLLLYVADTRDEYKGLKNKYAKEGDAYLESLYDKKQLPLKILANSFFGSLGAPHLFNWGSIDSAEEITCRGRIYLRLLVKHFWEKHGFRPLVGDTDGFNFAIPDDIENFSYVGKGNHRFTEKDKEYAGTAAAVAEFNDLYMIGRMGLDIDEYCRVTINFSRKNYVDIISKPDGGEKTKFVGNTIKSKKMPIYIEEFLDNAITMLLENQGKEFINYYYDYVEKIYNCQIPLVKIASKGKVKLTKHDYLEHCKKLNKKGNPLPRQAHMELMMRNNLDLDLGEVIYYVNTGTAKSHGDLKTIKHKDGRKEVQLNCMLIPAEQIESNPDLTTDEYNSLKYITMFNKRITPLLVVFDEEIRSQILIEAKKDRKTKEVFLEDRKVFTKAQCVMVPGIPYDEEDQDTYESLMSFEDKELKFWSGTDKQPNNLSDINISDEMWVEIIEDYKIREIEMKRLAFEKEIKTFKIIRDRIELPELDVFINFCETDTNKAILFIENYFPFLKVDLSNDSVTTLVSIEHEKVVADFNEIIEGYEIAEKRSIFYTTLHANYSGDKYQAWLKHGEEIAALMYTGKTANDEVVEEDLSVEIVDDEYEESPIIEEEENGWNF